MENYFFTFAYPRTHQHQIELNTGDFVRQEDVDSAFLSHLVKLSYGNFTKSIPDFLEFQFRKTKSDKTDFLNHACSIVQANEYQFKPYSEAVGVVNDWIEQKETDFSVRQELEKAKVESKVKARKKVDPTFQELFVDAQKYKDILRRLKLSGVIDDAHRWKLNRIDLVALVKILQEHNHIKKEKDAVYVRVFCKEFGVTMDRSNLSRGCNNDTIDDLKRQLSL
jgi:hypothetical protein